MSPSVAELVSLVQVALRDEAAMYDPPKALYEPTGSQLLDHVHHRIARLVIFTLRDHLEVTE